MLAGWIGMLLLGTALGQDVTFSTVASGQDKAITEWGIEVVQGSKSYNTARLYKGWLGADGIDVLWSFFWPGAALDGSGNLVQEHKDVADGFIDGGWTALFPNASWGFGPNINDTDAYFFPGGTFDSTRWYTLIKKTVEYYESRGQTVAHMMPYNEADFWAGQGNPYDLATIAQLLADDTSLDGIGIMGPSTLSSGNAYNDYTAFGSGGASGPLTYGSTHHLQWYDSASKIADFYTYDVLAHGDTPYNPELHALGEAIFSAEYGCRGGAWWADPVALLPRALFMKSCKGDRLGYAENRGAQNADYLTQSAAAVYRATDGELYGFAGGFERQGANGSMNNYRFVCTDRDVYFNGIGPIREYVLPIRQAQDAFVRIDYGTNNIMPALDGHRWKIVNRYNGKVLAVTGGGQTDGTDVRMETDTDSLNQKWDIIRMKDGYYRLYNANSGKVLDVTADTLSPGGNVQQWTFLNGFNQYWCIDKAGSGYCHIRGANSTLYLDGYNTSAIQWDANGEAWQQWQFVPADEAGSGTATAQYDFEGNANDSAGSHNGTTTGSPAYTTGQVGQAIDLNGSTDYVTLPSGIANVDDITVAAWVNWDGGNAQQRIFDFGDDTTNYFFLTPSDFNGQMHCAITTGSYKYENSLITDGLPVGQWVHVAVTLRGNTGILYVNGSPKVAGYMSLNPSDFNPVNNYIGKSQWPDPLFNGQIDDVRIYDYALTDSEIAAIALVTPPDTTPPAAPTALTATSDDGTIALDWADNTEPDFESYTVYRSITSGSNYVAVASGLTTSTNTDDTVTNGTTYYYVVSATDSNANESAYSSEVSAIPSVAVSPEEFFIADPAIEGGTNLLLTIDNTVLGHLYGILATDTLTPPVWSNILVQAGSGSNLLFNIPVNPVTTNRFFKLDVQRK